MTAQPKAEAGRVARRAPRKADSGTMAGYFGILNAEGQFWSHTVYRSADDAKRFIREFWRDQAEHADWCLRRFKIIPVRVRIEPLKDRAIAAKEQGDV